MVNLYDFLRSNKLEACAIVKSLGNKVDDNTYEVEIESEDEDGGVCVIASDWEGEYQPYTVKKVVFHKENACLTFVVENQSGDTEEISDMDCAYCSSDEVYQYLNGLAKQ